MPLTEHPAITHINSTLGTIEPKLAGAILRFWNQKKTELPDQELQILLTTGSATIFLEEKVARDTHELFWNIMVPHLQQAYNRAGGKGIERPDRWNARAERFITYYRTETLKTFRLLAQADKMTHVIRIFGLDFLRETYGLLATAAVRCLNWAYTRAVFKVSQEEQRRALERLTEAATSAEPIPVDPAERNRRKFEMIRAVSAAKKERAALIAAEEGTRAYHEGRYAALEEIQERLEATRAQLRGISAAPGAELRPPAFVEVPEEIFGELPADLEELEEPVEMLPYVENSQYFEVWVTNPEASVSGVCVVCAPLHGMERETGGYWPSMGVSQAMPRDEGVHINCKCTSEFYSVYYWSDGTIETTELRPTEY